MWIVWNKLRSLFCKHHYKMSSMHRRINGQIQVMCYDCGSWFKPKGT